MTRSGRPNSTTQLSKAQLPTKGIPIDQAMQGHVHTNSKPHWPPRRSHQKSDQGNDLAAKAAPMALQASQHVTGPRL